MHQGKFRDKKVRLRFIIEKEACAVWHLLRQFLFHSQNNTVWKFSKFVSTILLWTTVAFWPLCLISFDFINNQLLFWKVFIYVLLLIPQNLAKIVLFLFRSPFFNAFPILWALSALSSSSINFLSRYSLSSQLSTSSCLKNLPNWSLFWWLQFSRSVNFSVNVLYLPRSLLLWFGLLHILWKFSSSLLLLNGMLSCRSAISYFKLPCIPF